MQIKKTILIVGVLAFALALFAQEETKEIFALRVDVSIEVDGSLNEAVWKNAPDASNLMQFKPGGGRPPAGETAVKILYDDNFIYFGFLCYDSEPDKIEARVREKDEDLRDDDSVYILIDTIHDRDNYYYFSTNLIGAQLDGRIAFDGRTVNVAWDGIWKSASQKTDFGWSTEIAIDLSSLNYEPKNDKTLGLSLSRIVPRMIDSFFWSGPLDPAFKISQLGQLTRINLIKAAKRIRITPHTFSASESGDKLWFEWGVDVRYAFSQMVSGRLALNPDFLTVEADRERINLTRFELYLPEKRNFFQEGSSTYNQPIQLFYSKRIPSIFGGAKINGRYGSLEFSGMSVQARRDEYTGEDSAHFTVLRLKKNIKRKSSIGFLAANKLIGGKSTGAAGVDTSLVFSDSFKIAGQFAISYGDNNRDNIAYFLRPSYDTKTFHFHLGYFHLGSKFGDNVNRVGFIQDDNRSELDSAIVKTFLVKKGSLEQIRYDSNYNIYWGMDRALRSWQIDQGFTFELKNKFSLSLHHTQAYFAQDGELYEEDFRNIHTRLGISFNMKEWEYTLLAVTFGRNFGEGFSMLEIGKNLQLTKSLTVEFEMARIYFGYQRAERTDFIPMIRAIQEFTEDLSLKIFYQVSTRLGRMNIEGWLTYRFLPPSGIIQVVYQIGRGRFGLREEQGNTVYLKINYMF